MSDLPPLALSINNPWASLIVSGDKDLENRNWSTEFRGEFMIHAGLKHDKDCAEALVAGLHPVTREPTDMSHLTCMASGGIIGIAELYGVVTGKTGGADNPWFVGRYGFLLRNARPIELIPCIGALGFFRPDFTSRYKPRPVPVPAPRKVKAAPPAPPPQGSLFDGD